MFKHHTKHSNYTRTITYLRNISVRSVLEIATIKIKIKKLKREKSETHEMGAGNDGDCLWRKVIESRQISICLLSGDSAWRKQLLGSYWFTRKYLKVWKKVERIFQMRCISINKITDKFWNNTDNQKLWMFMTKSDRISRNIDVYFW